jgi:hypothetical protein
MNHGRKTLSGPPGDRRLASSVAARPVSVRPRSLSSLAATFVGSTGDEDPRDEKRHVESPDPVLL